MPRYSRVSVKQTGVRCSSSSERKARTVEKVGIQDSLHNARRDGDGIQRARDEARERVALKVPVYPVWDVERAVQAQREEVVRSDGLGLACPAQHEQLRQNGNALEEDGEGPEHFDRGAARKAYAGRGLFSAAPLRVQTREMDDGRHPAHKR